MSDNEVVRIVIDDIEVEGVVSCRSEFDFTIRITKPFCNLSGGSHIPHFAKAHMSFEGRYGDCSIKETLHDLYELGKYLDKEMDRLREEFIAYNNAVEKLSSEMITREEFLKKRI